MSIMQKLYTSEFGKDYKHKQNELNKKIKRTKKVVGIKDLLK